MNASKPTLAAALRWIYDPRFAGTGARRRQILAIRAEYASRKNGGAS